jgi:hypothetical protein
MPHVRVTARRRIAQFLVFNPAVLEIDGVPAGQARWGTTETVEVPAGRHSLTVFFQYLGRKRTGEASIDLDVAEGQTLDVSYRSPWVVTSKGSLTVT